MSAIVSSRAVQLFDTAIQLNGAERIEFLDRECAGDAELRRELDTLIDASTAANDYFDDLADRFGLTSIFRGDVELPSDESIGSYKPVRLIGRGGMGAVYLAQRADKQFDQIVALKVLPFGVGGEEARRRFLAERQILARLSHPNIAALLDGGITEQGTPYFVMEFVAGEPLTAYCDEHRLDIDARLELFGQIADAVQYAHRNLIVHRDLKPANVMVDDAGRVKLLDFGIAKLLTDDGYAQTQTGVLPMTSMYASPEMMKRDAIGTPSDVYALGVLLYELLAGRHPYGLSPGASGPDVWHHVCDVDPKPMSTAVLATADAEILEGRRSGDAHRLAQRLRGDLDTIVAKAMQKRPEARYGSVEQFAEDIRRHRDGLPVLAQPPSLTYRVRKFVRRQKGLVAAGIVAAVLVGGIVHQSSQTAREAARANREADVAEQVSDFLVSVFASSDPTVALGSEPTARELLDRGVRELPDTVNDPEVLARLKSTMGFVFAQLAQYEQAETLFDDALAIQRPQLGVDHADTLTTQNQLGLLYLDQGRLEDAQSLFEDTLVARRESLGADHADTLETMLNIAILLHRRGSYTEAVAAGEEVVEKLTHSFGADSIQTLRASAHLATFYKLDGDWGRAATLYASVIDAYEQVHPQREADIVGTMQNLADTYNDQDRVDEAEPLYKEVIARSREYYGDEHPRVTRAMTNFANMYKGMSDFERAEPLYLQAIEVQQRTLGSTHFETLNSKYNLAETYARTGRFSEAEALLVETFDGYRSGVGPYHRKTLAALGGLNATYFMMGDIPRARQKGEERLAAWRFVASEPGASPQDRLTYAWHLVSIDPADLRDPHAALPIVLAVNEETEFRQPRFIYVLALAYHDTGDTAKAIETMQLGIDRLPEGAEGPRQHYQELLDSWQ